MKKLILLLCIPFIGIAQTDYELAFNSATSDYVEMPNASSLIVNSTTFSMSAWVYPQANPAAHAGIMGFRNTAGSPSLFSHPSAPPPPHNTQPNSNSN